MNTHFTNRAKPNHLLDRTFAFDNDTWRVVEPLNFAADAAIVGDDKPLTINALIDAMRGGIDILYLACHGAMPKGKEPCLYLQNEDGTTAIVLASRRILESTAASTMRYPRGVRRPRPLNVPRENLTDRLLEVGHELEL